MSGAEVFARTNNQLYRFYSNSLWNKAKYLVSQKTANIRLLVFFSDI